MAEQLLKCPKCGSTQLTADKRGFNVGKAAAGAILTGGIGLLAGMHGSSKIKITCIACGNQFNPGQDKAALQNKSKEPLPIGCILILVVLIAAFFVFLKSC